MSQIDEFSNSQKRNDKNFLNSLNMNLIKFMKIRKEMDKIIVQDTNNRIVSQEQKKADVEVYKNILQNAKLRNVFIPKVDS
jgi:hypothetical protein